MAFALLFSTVMGLVLAVNFVPLLTVVVVPAVPLLSLGFMIATRKVLDGGFPTPQVFIDPVQLDRPRRIAHLRLGLIYMAATFAITALVTLIDGDGPAMLLESMPAASAPGAATPASAPEAAAAFAATPEALLGMTLRFALAGVLAIPFWHAPALVHWGGQGCAQALFSSTLACWRNRAAFAVYFLAWFAIVLGCSVLGSLILMLFGQAQLMMGAIIPLALIVGTMFYASLYFTFADCFASDDGQPLPLPRVNPA
jgi:hypothetical protein